MNVGEKQMLSQSLKRIAKKINAQRLDDDSYGVIIDLYMGDSDMHDAASTAHDNDTTADLVFALEVLARISEEEVDDEGMLNRGMVSEQLIDEAEADVMTEWEKWYEEVSEITSKKISSSKTYYLATASIIRGYHKWHTEVWVASTKDVLRSHARDEELSQKRIIGDEAEVSMGEITTVRLNENAVFDYCDENGYSWVG